MESLALLFTVCMLANYLISLSFSFPICNMKIVFSLRIRCVCVCMCVYIGGENGNPLQYPCLENCMDRRARWATQSMGLQRVGHN